MPNCYIIMLWKVRPLNCKTTVYVWRAVAAVLIYQRSWPHGLEFNTHVRDFRFKRKHQFHHWFQPKFVRQSWELLRPGDKLKPWNWAIHVWIAEFETIFIIFHRFEWDPDGQVESKLVDMTGHMAQSLAKSELMSQGTIAQYTGLWEDWEGDYRGPRGNLYLGWAVDKISNTPKPGVYFVLL